MKKLITILLSVVTLGVIAQPSTRIKYSQMENPATSSVNLGSQTFSTSGTVRSGTIINTGSITSPTVYGGSAASATLNLIGSSSATPGVVSVGSSTASGFIVNGTSTLTGQAKLTNTLNIIGNTTINSNQTNTLVTGNSGTVAVLSDAAFPVTFTQGNMSPTDATTYYICNFQYTSLVTSATAGRAILPYNCTLVAWSYSSLANGTLGTTEASTISVRANNSTDTQLSATILMDASNSYTATGLSTSFTAGDMINIKWVTPTWSTNPTAMFIGVTLWFVRRQ